jgi:hypothetical protein
LSETRCFIATAFEESMKIQNKPVATKSKGTRQLMINVADDNL